MTYWEQRSGLNYYRTVRQWIDELGPQESIIDVGARDTPVATWGTFEVRHAIDRGVLPDLPGVVGLQQDWLTFRPPIRYSLAVCLQVIEHLSDDQVRPFVNRLFASADRVIVSVPWGWPAGTCSYHKQDPIGPHKFRRLMGRRRPLKQVVVDDGRRRVIARFGLP
jgi:hypothetical protein